MNKNLLRLIDNLNTVKQPLINHFKRQDVFRCKHDAHDRFNSTVSVYHVLKVKKCFPAGCTFFRWKCRNLDKGKTCPRKFKHVGRLCFSCSYFYDIKETNRPEFIPGVHELQHFKDELSRFEDWIESVQGKQVVMSAKIISVKPEFVLKKGPKRHQVLLHGFLLTLNDCFINHTVFRDLIYAPVSINAQNRFTFAQDTIIDCRGYFTFSNGMIIIRDIKSVELTPGKFSAAWNETSARVIQKTGVVLPYQFPTCHACDKSSLLEVVADDASPDKPRALFCFEGVTEPDLCSYRAQRLISPVCLSDACDVL